VLAVVHPTYAIFLWIPFVGFLLVRALWTRQDLRPGGVVLAALAVQFIITGVTNAFP
jgi:small neutral amino acid transporter SnatA (MarC family)